MKIGKGCKISDMVRIYGEENIEIGDNVRIDEFCILTGGKGLKIGNHVHVAAYSILYGTGGLEIGDFFGGAVRTTILTSSDDYSGRSMVGPCIPRKYKTGNFTKPVKIGRQVILGVGVVVYPGVTIGEGVAVGAYSFVKHDCLPWSLYAGIPARRKGGRAADILDLERRFLEEYV